MDECSQHLPRGEDELGGGKRVKSLNTIVEPGIPIWN